MILYLKLKNLRLAHRQKRSKRKEKICQNWRFWLPKSEN